VTFVAGGSLSGLLSNFISNYVSRPEAMRKGMEMIEITVEDWDDTRRKKALVGSWLVRDQGSDAEDQSGVVWSVLQTLQGRFAVLSDNQYRANLFEVFDSLEEAEERLPSDIFCPRDGRRQIERRRGRMGYLNRVGFC
jgi:phage terminase large subunit-like protein